MLGGFLAPLRNHQIPQVMVGGKQEQGQECGEHRGKGWELPQHPRQSHPGHKGPSSLAEPPREHPRSPGSTCLEQLGSLAGAGLAPAAWVAQIAPLCPHLRVVWLKCLWLPDTPSAKWD